MNQQQKKIAIVAGNLKDMRLLQIFEGLKNEYDISVYIIENNKLNGNCGLKLHLFEDLIDMPGYMRALEEHISNADLIIGIETSKLSSFQALRVAKKLDKPFAALVTEHTPNFYENYQNIQAIQSDILENTDTFWATSDTCIQRLKQEGVSETKISKINPIVNNQKFIYSKQRRNKFKEYINVADDKYIFLYHGPLEPQYRVDEILKSVALLQKINPKVASQIKILIAGNGSQSKDLKYLSVDYRLGDTIMFLHQNPNAFISDLYSSSDAIFSLKPHKNEIHEPLPLNILDAMACGSIPIYSSFTITEEYAHNAGIKLFEDGPKSLARAMQNLVVNNNLRNQESKKATEIITEFFTYNKIIDVLDKDLDNLFSISAKLNLNTFDFNDAVNKIEVSMLTEHPSYPLVKIEELLLKEPSNPLILSKILYLKGDILYALGKFNESVDAYTKSLELNEKNHRAYKGLGYVSYKSHSYEEAITFFKKALSYNNNDILSMIGIGYVQRKVGADEYALYWFERCLNIDNENQQALAAIIQTCLEIPNQEYAIEILERMVNLVGEKPQLMMSLGQLYMKSGKSEIGSKMVQNALNKDTHKE